MSAGPGPFVLFWSFGALALGPLVRIVTLAHGSDVQAVRRASNKL